VNGPLFDGSEKQGKRANREVDRTGRFETGPAKAGEARIISLQQVYFQAIDRSNRQIWKAESVLYEV
jgi:hypothetical protein